MAFSLTELLVVIAILALLLSLLLPGVRMVRQQAARTVCANSQHQLFLAWKLYGADNEGAIVNSRTFTGGLSSRWLYTDGSGIAVLNGGKLQGALIDYFESSERLLFCPGQPADERLNRMNTFSFSDRMAPNPTGNNISGNSWLTYESQIRHPAAQMIIVEVRMNYDGFNTKFRTKWGDTPAPFHATGHNQTYADGHADWYSWSDRASLLNAVRNVTPSNPKDVAFLYDSNLPP